VVVDKGVVVVEAVVVDEGEEDEKDSEDDDAEVASVVEVEKRCWSICLSGSTS
jgi:hypothetical protein